MTTGRLNRWLLVNYAGYPYAPNSLMPDNGLANLAGALLAQGCEVEILDYCTVSMIQRMTTPELRERLSRTWNTFRTSDRGITASLRKIAAMASLPGAEKERRRLQDLAVTIIGSELISHIQRKGIDAVGFKLWNGDGLAGSGRLAAILRRQFPGLKIFGGGPHVDLFQDRILGHYPDFDSLVYGEGEETIQHLALNGGDSLSYSTIPNQIYRINGKTQITEERMIADLDQLPMPVYDPAVYPAMAGNEKVKVIVIDESRGCRNECTFCIHPVKSHRRVRLKSISRLILEVKELDRRYGFRSFRFAGSCTPYSLLNEFAAGIVREKLPVRYASFAHIRDAEEANFELIRKSGGMALFFGIESCSQTILDGMRKHITVSAIQETLRRSHDAGIFTVGSLIFPAPGETAATEAEALALLPKLNLNALMLQAPIVTPRTSWFEEPGYYGIAIPDKEHYLEVGMKWKVKLQLPPRFWDSIPLTIGGRSFKQVLAKTGEMGRKIGGMGIPTSISDETYLMSLKSGLDPEKFRDGALAAFYSGNTEAIQDLVTAINRPGAESSG
jgi:hypothetical protein